MQVVGHRPITSHFGFFGNSVSGFGSKSSYLTFLFNNNNNKLYLFSTNALPIVYKVF
jgi:hypothetical protein